MEEVEILFYTLHGLRCTSILVIVVQCWLDDNRHDVQRCNQVRLPLCVEFCILGSTTLSQQLLLKRVGSSSTQYDNVIVRLNSVWIGVELVTVAGYQYRRRRGGVATLPSNSRNRAEVMIWRGMPRRPQYIKNRNKQHANQCTIKHILCTCYHHRETRGSRVVHNNQPAGVKAMRRLYTQRREFKGKRPWYVFQCMHSVLSKVVY